STATRLFHGTKPLCPSRASGDPRNGSDDPLCRECLRRLAAACRELAHARVAQCSDAARLYAGRSMIRNTIFYGVLVGIIAMGFRNWFWSLCALIALTALGEHENFKENLFNVQGLKPWNILCAFVVLQWATQRRADGLQGGAPPIVVLAFCCFVVSILWGAVLAILDLEFLLKQSK